MSSIARQATIVVVTVALGICLSAGGLTLAYAARSWDDEVRVEMDRELLQVHSKDDGWGELPCLVATSDYAYVAYDVREGYQSHVYLCQIPRDAAEPQITKIRLDTGGEIEFAPSMSMDHRGGIWVAWTSFRNKQWAIRAVYVLGMEIAAEQMISTTEGFNSQVRIESKEGTTWFAWVVWDHDGYRIVASSLEGTSGKSITVQEGKGPVGRPDLHVFARDHVLFAWDEYVGGKHIIRSREYRNDELGPVQNLSSPEYAHSWEPHIAVAGDRVLTAWHRVPGGSGRCQPAAALSGGPTFEYGIDRPEDRETWRVRCFRDGNGDTWIAWTNRFLYRNTKLYMRRIDETGLSERCRIDPPIRRNFINWFDCKWDGNLVFTWEYSGTVYISEIDLPLLEGLGYPPDEAAGYSDTVRVVRPARPERVDYSIDYGGEHLTVFFGDGHNHTSFSDGRGYPDISVVLARDYRGLDYICITDHDITLTPGEFAWNNTVADMLTVEGDYACLHGYEPSKGWAQNAYGHWNMLLPKEGDVFQFEEGMTPKQLQDYARQHDAVLVPHHVGKKFAPYDWDYFDATAEPVVEMCSIHGIFETYRGNEDKPDMVEGKFVEDGLERGYHFGFIGASDSHNCFGALLGACGITGVYVPSLTPDAIFEAFRKRRTFALTGSRIVVDFRCNGKLMGEEIEGADRLRFTAYATSPDSIVAATIVSAKHAVYQHPVCAPEAGFEWEIAAPDSEAYYYLKVETAKGDLAWSSPIWSVPKR